MARAMMVGAGLLLMVVGAGLFGGADAVPGTGPATGAATTGVGTMAILMDVRVRGEKVEVLGTVNGEGIDAGKLRALLMASEGARVFGEMMDGMLAEQACEMAGVDTKSKSFEERVAAELERRRRPLKAGLYGARYEGLDTSSRFDGMLMARRDACLRVLAEDRVTVTDKMVVDEYMSQYGERIHGRIFTVHTLIDCTKIRAILEQGGSIDEVTAAYSGRDLILPMNVNFDDAVGILQKLKNASFHAKEKQLVGPISQEGNGTFVLFYLERRESSRLEEVKFADVKGGLRAELTEQAQQNWMNGHLVKLRGMANVTINDPALAAAYAEYRKVQEGSAMTVHLGEATTQGAEPRR